MSRKQFEKYCRESGSIKRNTIGSYSSAINSISLWLQNIPQYKLGDFVFDGNIYNITSSSEYTVLSDFFANNDDFLKINSEQHNRWRAASKKYLEFLKNAEAEGVKIVSDSATPARSFAEQVREQEKDADLSEGSINYNSDDVNVHPRNLIYFGAPGTGKSYILNDKKDILLGNDGKFERVTFYPDYSYANFVGSYKPVPKNGKEDSSDISYEFVAGPFMRVYVDALKGALANNYIPHLLIIEEINRADVAAVFGDVFQLLDRDKDGWSKYEIQVSAEMARYLASELPEYPEEQSRLHIPPNMYIWATMNSADQGVFPMDTAFKRRWDFKYIGIDDSSDRIKDVYVKLGNDDYNREIYWNCLRMAINDFMADLEINEDKQLGPYFLSEDIIIPRESKVRQINSKNFVDAFENKVIMYLFEDAGRQKRSQIFSSIWNECKRYSQICKKFESVGIDIFDEKIKGYYESYKKKLLHE